jgi:hypothetical protein
MTRHATLKYSESLVVQAVRAYWRRSVGSMTLLAAAAIVGLFIWSLLRGDRSWLMGLLAGATLLVVALPLAVYLTHYRNSLGKFRSMRSPQAAFSADDETFTISSDQGTVTLPWSSIQELWCFASFWLLLFSRAQFATFPLDGVPVELREFVLLRAKTAGAKIAA